MDKKNPLKELRESKGFSLKEMGLIVGLSYPNYYNLETGYTSRIPKRVLKILEDVFKIDAVVFEKRFQDWINEHREKILEKVK